MDLPAATSSPPNATSRLLRWRQATDGPFSVLAIGSLPLLLVELERAELTRADRLFLDVTNIVVLVAFAVDYIVELVLARDRRSFVRHEWTSLLIVLSQAVAVVPAFAGFGILRALRSARALRGVVVLIRLLAVGGTTARQRCSILRRRAATFALGLAGLTWLSSAAAFTLAEDVGDRHRIASFFDASGGQRARSRLSATGTIFPVTAAGRLIGGLTMVVGVSTFAVVTAKVTEFLVRSTPAEPTASDDQPISATEPA